MANIKTETFSGQSQAAYDQAKLGELIFVLMVYIHVYDSAINIKNKKTKQCAETNVKVTLGL
jgi:hypothetical protein